MKEYEPVESTHTILKLWGDVLLLLVYKIILVTTQHP